MLDGYKTHIIVAIFIICVVIESLGFDIPGFDATGHETEMILSALGVSTVRDAIRKLIG